MKYKVLMYDAYGKLVRDFTIAGAVDLSSAASIGSSAMSAFPGNAVILDPVVMKEMALAAHA